MENIIIISRVDSDFQAWQFDISENDIFNLVEKYGASGSSVRGSMLDIIEELREGANNG